MAEIEIAALDLSPSSATIRLTFGRSADAVEVTSGAAFSEGAVATLPVMFVPGAGRSYLAVMVTGTFAGREDVKVEEKQVSEVACR